jgi:conjugal transfer pilus assembly protein TrbC
MASATPSRRQVPRGKSDDVFDFDKMVADAGTMASDGLGEAPRFIAFASLSMPPAALRAMADDVAKAGGVDRAARPAGWQRQDPYGDAGENRR